MRDHLPITLERLAALQARLDVGASLDALLAEEALALEIYDRARRGWLARMSAEIAQRSYLLAQRYQAAYLSERPDLAADRITPAVDLPAAPPAEDIDGTAMALNLDLGAALPFGEASDEASPPSTEGDDEEAPTVEDDPDALPTWKDPTQATQFVSALPDIAALPFADAEAASTPTAPTAPPSPSAQASPPQPPPQAPPIAPRAAPPAPPASPSDQQVDETIMVGDLRLDLDGALGDAPDRQTLPFQGDAAQPPTALDDLPPMPAGDVDGTAFAAPIADVPSTPFASPAAPPPAAPPATAPTATPASPPTVPPAPLTLTEAQYASFCGERRYAPAAVEAVHRRYGIASSQQAQALDAHWQARRQADPALAARLDDLIAQYLAWLAQQH